MVNKIIASTIFVSALFALSLSVMGVEAPIELGTEFQWFLAKTSGELAEVKLEIPDIPNIPQMADPSGLENVLDVLIQFINGLINILNVLIMAVNAIIQALQFLFILLKNFIALRDRIIAQ